MTEISCLCQSLLDEEDDEEDTEESDSGSESRGTLLLSFKVNLSKYHVLYFASKIKINW